MVPLFLALLSTPTATASTAGVSPSWIDAPVVPGQTTRFQINVANESRGLLNFDAAVGDVWYHPDTMTAVYPPAGTSPLSVAAYTTVFPERLAVPPGEVAAFTVTVTTPEDTDSSLFGAVVIQSRPYQADVQTTMAQTALSFRVPMLLAPSERGQHELSVRSAVVVPPADATPGQLVLDIENVGTVHERPNVRAVVRDTESGSVIATIAGESPKYYLPGQNREAAFPWSASLGPGTYDVLGAIRYGTEGVTPVQAQLVIPAAEPPTDQASP